MGSPVGGIRTMCARECFCAAGLKLSSAVRSYHSGNRRGRAGPSAKGLMRLLVLLPAAADVPASTNP